MKKFLCFAHLVVMFFSLPTLAGNERGNGGNTSCLEYMHLAKRVSKAMLRRTQEHFDERGIEIDVQKISSVTSKLKCIPVDNLDRNARTLHGQQEVVTTLFATKWEELDATERLKLVIHELLVGSEYEGDGEYHKTLLIADDIRPMKDFLDLNAHTVTYMPDGTVVIQRPFLVIGGIQYWLIPYDVYNPPLYSGDEDFKGVCIFLGFEETLFVRYGYIDNTEKPQPFVGLSRQGTIKGLYPGDSQEKKTIRVEDVTCR